MNKKNKNKNRSKPTNTAPVLQKPEPAQIIEDTITVIVEEKSVSLVSESDIVPEITSEATELVQENDELPTDTPKKPKRNKGKKKKQDEISIEETKPDFTQDAASLPPPVPDSEVKTQDESIVSMGTKIDEEDKNVTQNITASVRKKKNKKKPQEQQKIEVQSIEIPIVKKLEDDLEKQESLADNTTKPDLNISETTESDIKQSKKKNKKKKHRRDSDKSDKADEAVICTAAFQKLISSTATEADTNPETNVESIKDDVQKAKRLYISEETKEETPKDLIESVLLPQESKPSEDEGLQHDQGTEKSKKKAKKDKKQQQPKIDNEKSILREEKVIQLEPLGVLNSTEQESPSIQQVECTVKDTVTNVKAKIAKPVEKKRRGKVELYQDTDNKQEKDIVKTQLDVMESIENMTENICAPVMSSPLNVLSTEETLKPEQVNTIDAAVMLPIQASETLISTDMIPSLTETPIIESNVNLADINIGIKSNEAINKSSVVTSDSNVLKSDMESENITSGTSFSLDIPENKDALFPSEPYKTVEKKKKKHPKKIELSVEKSPEYKTLVTPETESTIEEIPHKLNEDIFSGTSTQGDVQISSLKTDELDGSSDVTPDFIHHPLATSQQFIDNNNNMVIRDITATDEKLSPHLLIPIEPIIQDSGETPEPVGVTITTESPSLILIREKSLTNEPEKTDLKSKMMEVSQDMEELRLSIERSLAELTSMEKSDQDIVKGLEEIQTTEPSSSDVKGDISENNSILCENKSSEIIIREPHVTSEGPINVLETINQKREILSEAENVPETNIEISAQKKSDEYKDIDVKESPPQAPIRKDHKGKGKGKRKGKQEIQCHQTTSVPEAVTGTASENTSKEVKKEEKEEPEQKSQSSESSENKGKQQHQTMQVDIDYNESKEVPNDSISNIVELSFEPIEHFEDALTSSVDDVNKTFEMIANDVNNTPELTLQNPQINVTSPTEETEVVEPKQNPVSPPKNLLGHPDIPVPSNRADYKKEKNKPPNMRQAKVKIKDAVDIEKTEKSMQSKESQTENKQKKINNKNVLESFSYMTNENAEYVYKYSFRKVFLQSLCHVCRKELGQRVPCQFCSLVFYCSQKHKDEDWSPHQSLCFAICTIAHLKDQKHIYDDAKNLTGQSYRLLRMQMIISCEKVLKRKLMAWEQEALLYPRMCADVACREWKQSKLVDCEGCGQISYCSEDPGHLPVSHQRWCRSYALYQKLVHHQQTRGRLEPKLPTRVMTEGYRIPEKINEVLAAMYDEKIDMTDMEYAALTQLATGPLTAAYCHQIVTPNHSNGISKKTSFVIHIVGAELQFEADVLFKWEVFFLHLKPHVKELRVVLVSPDLNPSNLPLNLLEKINLCESCRAEKRRVIFSFQDKKTYYEYWASDEFITADIVCAFNPSIQRSSMYNGKDTWPTAVSCILKLKVPLIVSSYSIDELKRDVARIKECSELSGVGFKTISEPKCNPFASVRPDRNFITDDEIPLLFKNYSFVVLCGV